MNEQNWIECKEYIKELFDLFENTYCIDEVGVANPSKYIFNDAKFEAILEVNEVLQDNYDENKAISTYCIDLNFSDNLFEIWKEVVMNGGTNCLWSEAYTNFEEILEYISDTLDIECDNLNDYVNNHRDLFNPEG
ncbi:MAG: hypothetical protein VZS44_09905 [Bacilli bacterium]|nr:hypothetical protein [Bacilli bacterium]